MDILNAITINDTIFHEGINNNYNSNNNNNNNLNYNTTQIFNFYKNYDDEGDEYWAEQNKIRSIVTILVPIFFGIITITGIFGNTLVILVVLLNSQMRSTTNLLIVNLACADLLFVIFCIPFTASDYIFCKWPYGELWCKIVQYLIVVMAFSSIYTLVLMSFDRYLAVVHPITSRAIRTEKITQICILILWTIIFMLSLPVLFAHGLIEYNYNDHECLSCRYLTTSLISQTNYVLIFTSITYFLPLLLISGLYMRIVSRLWRSVGGARMSAESQRGRRRVTRLVVVVVIAFASMWLPVQIILVLKSFELYTSDSLFTVLLQVMAQTLAYATACINPLLYAFLSENFRKAFHKAVYCKSKYFQQYSAAASTNINSSNAGRRISTAKTSTIAI